VCVCVCVCVCVRWRRRGRGGQRLHNIFDVLESTAASSLQARSLALIDSLALACDGTSAVADTTQR
jgi:hypothetical protein